MSGRALDPLATQLPPSVFGDDDISQLSRSHTGEIELSRSRSASQAIMLPLAPRQGSGNIIAKPRGQPITVKIPHEDQEHLHRQVHEFLLGIRLESKHPRTKVAISSTDAEAGIDDFDDSPIPARRLLEFRTARSNGYLSSVVVLPHRRRRSGRHGPLELSHANLTRVKRRSQSHADLIKATGEYPMLLDDPSIELGGVRTVRLVLGGAIVSIAPYVGQKELKAAMNDVFRQRNPNLVGGIRLTQLRKMKKKMASLALDPTPAPWTPPSARAHLVDTSCILALSTVAAAAIYLENLIGRSRVDSDVRQVVACACILLATKFHEPYQKEKVGPLLHALSKLFGVPTDRIVSAEIPTWVALEFSLVLPPDVITAQMSRLVFLAGGDGEGEYDDII
ncbi:Cables2 protein [Carpediemonas membranifera]|uniref:Cables2 protein n=1 Tax=Carpediemonas membranifera TaxID=201153 RepID=A0A8J6ASZ4_9EUKA|nr:Cables2 protein [Carpediemonas membranifera]|eukprot:KAG9393313.1 Cables2 protein [Carpediemonas membranifera]